MAQRTTIPPWLNRLIVGAYRLAGGIARGRTLLLTTTGPRTGRTYVTPLFYVIDGGTYVVVGSNGGASKDPAWIGHLRAGTPATIEIGRRTTRVHPEVPDSSESERLYRRFIAERGKNYAGYRDLTTRSMPVVRLHPTP